MLFVGYEMITYIVFNGLTYNMSNEQNVRAHLLSHRISDLLFHLKKITSKFLFFFSPSARKPMKCGF